MYQGIFAYPMDRYTMECYTQLNFHPIKDRRYLYVLRETSYHDLVATCHMVRVHMGFINKDTLMMILMYLPDLNVNKLKERLNYIYTKKTMMFYWASEEPEDNPRYSFKNKFNGSLVRYKFKPQWIHKKKATALITQGYARAVLANTSESELDEWHRLICIVNTGRVGFITWYKLWDTTYELVLDGCEPDDLSESFVMYFR